MLQAMNTGHDGSLTTITPTRARRTDPLRDDDLDAELNLPEKAMRQQIASALDVVIQIARLSDGSARVRRSQRDRRHGRRVITMQDIFTYERSGLDPRVAAQGRFKATGIRPRFADRLRQAGSSCRWRCSTCTRGRRPLERRVHLRPGVEPMAWLIPITAASSRLASRICSELARDAQRGAYCAARSRAAADALVRTLVEEEGLVKLLREEELSTCRSCAP